MLQCWCLLLPTHVVTVYQEHYKSILRVFSISIFHPFSGCSSPTLQPIVLDPPLHLLFVFKRKWGKWGKWTGASVQLLNSTGGETVDMRNQSHQALWRSTGAGGMLTVSFIIWLWKCPQNVLLVDLKQMNRVIWWEISGLGSIRDSAGEVASA